MKSNFLLPNKLKMIGLLLFVPFFILGIMSMYFELRFDFLQINSKEDSVFSDKNFNLTDEIVLTGLIISLLMIAFSRVKQEDEYIHFMRLESWQWAVVVNFLLLIAATWIFYGSNFMDVMIYNMLTIPILFIIRFHYLLLMAKKSEAKTYPL